MSLIRNWLQETSTGQLEKIKKFQYSKQKNEETIKS